LFVSLSEMAAGSANGLEVAIAEVVSSRRELKAES
jgi:hypothetical protein